MEDLEKLDTVLKFLKIDTGYDSEYVFNKSGITNTSKQEVYLILDKLHSDGYVHQTEHENSPEPVGFGRVKIVTDKFYSINFKGKIFVQSGGYSISLKTGNRKNQIQNLKDWLMIFGTWLAGLGAFAYIVWEIYKHYYLHID